MYTPFLLKHERDQDLRMAELTNQVSKFEIATNFGPGRNRRKSIQGLDDMDWTKQGDAIEYKDNPEDPGAGMGWSHEEEVEEIEFGEKT